jgi:hypothetical protein
MSDCSNGEKTCDGAGLMRHAECNGFGWLTMGGKRYKLRNGAANLAASTTKQGCTGCGGGAKVVGTGLVACGCVDLGLIPGTLDARPGVTVDLDALTAGVDMGPQWDAAGAA